MSMNIFENFHRYYKVLEDVYKNDTLTLEGIQAPLLGVIHGQLVEASANDELKNGIYLQVALSDELFLDKNIEGWKNKMLEHQVFNTQHAGEKIHQDLHDIMQNPFAYHRDMLYVYFLILSFGFKGDLSKTSIQKYKANLAQILFPHETQDKEPYLIPENFNFTQKHPPTGFVPDIYLWLRISGVLFFLYILATSFYWFMLQKEMKDIVNVLETRVKVERAHA